VSVTDVTAQVDSSLIATAGTVLVSVTNNAGDLEQPPLRHLASNCHSDSQFGSSRRGGLYPDRHWRGLRLQCDGAMEQRSFEYELCERHNVDGSRDRRSRQQSGDCHRHRSRQRGDI
jgi:hypothetical protein